jgi:acyl-ACP thioesterase
MEKSYLDIMLGHYNNGYYLDTLLDLMCQQAKMNRPQLVEYLRSNGVVFEIREKYIKIDGERIRAESMDTIILSKTVNPRM